MPENISHVERLRAFAAERGLPIHFSPIVLSGTYYSNLEQAEMLGFVPNSPASQQAQDFFGTLGAEDATTLRHYYRDAQHMLSGAPRDRTCMMGFFGCVVEYTGEVYPCVNWEEQSFGNLLHERFDDIWFGPRAYAARAALRETGCPTCPSMCYVQPVNAGELITSKARKVAGRVRRIATPRRAGAAKP